MRSIFSEVVLTRFHMRLVVLLTSLVAAVLGLLGPFFQKEFIDKLTGVESKIQLVTWNHPLAFIVGAFVCVLFAQCFTQLTNYLATRESLIMQKILAKRLYDKTLGLKVDTMSGRPLGEVVQLYATDVPGSTVFLDQTLPSGSSTLFPFLLAPYAISVLFNIPLWPTVGVMIFITLINTTLALRQSKFFYYFKTLAGQRIGLTNEWIQNIRTIRILGWIRYFEKNIFDKREVETTNRVSMVTNGQVMNSISTSITFVLNVVTLMSFIHYSNHTITGGELLALLWIVGVFLVRPFRQMPWFFTHMFDSWTSIRRLEEYFNTQNNLTPKPVSPPELIPTVPEIALDVQGLNLTIGKKEILKDISLRVKEGEFVAVVGEVGSGKSLLLLSLLGETGAHFQHYFINGKDMLKSSSDEMRSHYSYVPQEGFIMSASLRENVAFLYDIEPESDDSISESLRLAQFDLSTERVENGLSTDIGERGVNLSGGQRQRVGLARVHFHNAPIMLLDDCLSAVDVDTEQKLFEQLLLGEWKDRTRVLVTHRLSVLNRVDRIIFLDNGRVLDSGSFAELLSRNKTFQEYAMTVAKEQSEKEKEAQNVPG